MSFADSLETILQQLNTPLTPESAARRTRGEITFAARLAELHPESAQQWQELILRAGELLLNWEPSAVSVELPAIQREIEGILAPIGRVAKQYTIHCCGHAHIDMNWTWPLLETVSTAHDTFATLNELMDLFPDLKFGQSQIAIYEMMQTYCPEIWEMIRRRISEGLWQVTAGSWVEGDKNMASGESLCRHILYSKRWLKENLGLPYDTVKIDWMPDTFGHPWSLPSILSVGGIRRYYRCRPENGPWLNWWEGPDGSRVLAFRDKGWYNAEITADLLTRHFTDYVKENGLKDFLWVYGVGDHGGGVTRGHLDNARELDSRPVFPNVKLSTIDAYFDAIEPVAEHIPVLDGDFNTTFEGCYTSQSRIKRVNRLAETIIPEAESISLVAGCAADFEYRSDQLQSAWRHMMFNQFHDILAGSSGHAAMEEAETGFQQVEAISGSIKMRALRALANRVNTAGALGIEPPKNASDSRAPSFGRGAGDIRVPGRISTWSSGTQDVEPLVVFNSLPYPRSEMTVMKVWGRDWPEDRIVIVDGQGSEIPGQVIGTSNDVGHKATNVLFPVRDVPAMGYRTYGVRLGDAPVKRQGVTIPAQSQMENEFFCVEIDPPTGAIKHLMDKSRGRDWVPEGKLLGLLELYQEAPHAMTAWSIGSIESRHDLTDGTPIDESDPRDSRQGDSLGMVYSTRHQQRGSHRVSCRTLHLVNSSRVRLEIALTAGSPLIEIGVSADWYEWGSPDTGVPMLKLALPLDMSEPRFITEIPFGSQERPGDGREFPAQRWVDLSDASHGATLVNDCKYGFSADGGTLRSTLLRSTYDPDAYPEMGQHEMRFGLLPHTGPCDPSQAARAAEAWNQPLTVVGTGIHNGDLPASTGWVEVLTPNVSLAALKKAEDSDAVVVRLYETAGREVDAKVRLDGIVAPGSRCTRLDLLEQPLEGSSPRMEGNVLIATLPAHGIATIAVGPE